MSERQAQDARNQTIFREMNEWTRENNEARLGHGRLTDIYLCECSDGACTDPIDLTIEEYEAIRSSPTTFAIALNHENPEIDRVISEHDGYAEVEKFFGEARRIAAASDPRA